MTFKKSSFCLWEAGSYSHKPIIIDASVSLSIFNSYFQTRLKHKKTHVQYISTSRAVYSLHKLVTSFPNDNLLPCNNNPVDWFLREWKK